MQPVAAKKEGIVKKTVLCMVVLAFIASCVLSLACAGEVTRTVTVAGPGSTITGPAQNVTVTMPGSTQRVVLPPLTGTPPLTPHSLTWDADEPCFFCHPIPRGHEGRSMQLGICGDCHQEGPQLLF